MRACLITLMLLCQTPVWADQAAGESGVIYRSTDHNGNAVFTDNPTDKSRAEPVRIRPPNSVPMSAPMPVAERHADREKQSAENQFKGYQTLAITAPEDQATVRDPDQPVAIQVRLEPALREGHRLVVLDNGVPIEGQALVDPNRGSHELQAVIEDASGTRLASSEAVVVHVHRTQVRRRHGATGSGLPALGGAARPGSAARSGGAARPGAGAKAGAAAGLGQGAKPSSVAKPRSPSK